MNAVPDVTATGSELLVGYYLGVNRKPAKQAATPARALTNEELAKVDFRFTFDVQSKVLEFKVYNGNSDLSIVGYRVGEVEIATTDSMAFLVEIADDYRAVFREDGFSNPDSVILATCRSQPTAREIPHELRGLFVEVSKAQPLSYAEYDQYVDSFSDRTPCWFWLEAAWGQELEERNN